MLKVALNRELLRLSHKWGKKGMGGWYYKISVENRNLGPGIKSHRNLRKAQPPGHTEPYTGKLLGIQDILRGLWPCPLSEVEVHGSLLPPLNTQLCCLLLCVFSFLPQLPKDWFCLSAYSHTQSQDSNWLSQGDSLCFHLGRVFPAKLIFHHLARGLAALGSDAHPRSYQQRPNMEGQVNKSTELLGPLTTARSLAWNIFLRTGFWTWVMMTDYLIGEGKKKKMKKPQAQYQTKRRKKLEKCSFKPHQMFHRSLSNISLFK